MTQENSRECNPEDVICQMEVLRHLKGLEEQLGSERFLEKYPQLAGVKNQISADVKVQDKVVQEALDECGREEETLEPAGSEEVEEPEPEKEE